MTDRKQNKRRLGGAYESRAAEYLRGLGLEIRETNYRCRIGEIDLIAQDGNTLVFVEVKYRTSARLGAPEEAVSIKKQQTIARVAQHYLLRFHAANVACRFDVVAIEGSVIRHIPDAFTL